MVSAVQAQGKHSYLRQIKKKALSMELHEHPLWHRLLYYRSTLTGYVSDADGKGFFLSKEGRKNPEKELLANLEAFMNAKDQPADAQCKFPARFSWLKQNIPLLREKAPAVSCTDYKDWYNTLAPQEIKFIFASFYAGNPASMFGHTFLFIKKKARVLNHCWAMHSASLPIFLNLIGLNIFSRV